METEILQSKSHLLSKEYQTLNIIISSGRSKQFLGREICIKELDSMDQYTIEAYYKIYELNYADKINENIIHSIVGAYAKLINKFLPIDDVKKLEQDLNSDYILMNELKNITGSIAATCGKFMSLFSLSFITFKHIQIQAKELVNDNCHDSELQAIELVTEPCSAGKANKEH